MDIKFRRAYSQRVTKDSDESDIEARDSEAARRPLPLGTVSLLFMDIEGSTRMIEALGQVYVAVLHEHRKIVRGLLESHSGREVDTQGDSLFAAFGRAVDAVLCAAAIQRAMSAHVWPDGISLRLRMGIHTGEPTLSGGAYVGLDVHLAARIGSAAHGQQVLLSQTSAVLVDGALTDGLRLRSLGEFHVKDLPRPQILFQLEIPDLPHDFPPPRNSASRRGFIPAQLSSFVGRQRELEELITVLPTRRLVTLTGPGGTGKTRLACAVAEHFFSSEHFPSGVWVCELAGVGRDSPGDGGESDQDSSIVAAIASTLEVPAHGSPRRVLEQWLTNRKTLLVLDNCEHLIDSCSRVVDYFLKACPGLCILATSREALGIQGESVWRVPSLSLPKLDAAKAEEIEDSEAVALFLDRARAARPSFSLDPQNAPVVAEICVRLDGIPLAIELAASRLQILSPRQIADRLDDRFRLLTGGRRNALPRQQTLKALIDWSHDLLSPDEKRLFRRLSVFSGGWSIEAVLAVCTMEGESDVDLVDLLSGLIDKSLVSAFDSEGLARYSFLQTMRHYASEKLMDSGEAALVRERHADFYRLMVAEADRRLRGSEQFVWLETLDRELDNIHLALDWLCSREGDLIELCCSLWRYWRVRGRYTEGRTWLAKALTGTGISAEQRARGLMSMGSLAAYQSDFTIARPLFEQGLEIYRSLGASRESANLLNMMGSCDLSLGRYDEARADVGESLAIFEEISYERGIAYALFTQGSIDMALAGFDSARQILERSLAILEKLHDRWWIGAARFQLAWIRDREGSHEAARDLLREILGEQRKLGDQRGTARCLLYLAEAQTHCGQFADAKESVMESLEIVDRLCDKWWLAVCLLVLAMCEYSLGDSEKSARLLGHAEGLHETMKAPAMPVYKTELESLGQKLESALGQAVFESQKASGRAYCLEDLVAG